MELLNKFGFNPPLFIAQIINFLILAFLFKLLLYKPILKMIKDRQNTIGKGLTDAENARVALEKAQTEKDKILSIASKEAQAILNDTKKAAIQTREEILEQTRMNAQKIIDQARLSAQAEMEKMRGEARNLSLEMSRHILDTITSKLFTKDEKDKIIKRGLEQIKVV